MMDLGRVKPILALCLAVTAVLAITASSAAAAGAPIVKEESWPEMVNVATESFPLEVNPNGASTTVRIEYVERGSGAYETTGAQSLGSGTSYVKTKQSVRVKPYDEYEAWAVASNSFGTTKTMIAGGCCYLTTPRWTINSKAGTSGFSTSGTWKLEYQVSGVKGRMECTESGSGTLGHEAASGDGYSLTASNCSYYVNGTYVCHPKDWKVQFNGAFKQAETTVSFQYCLGEETVQKLTIAEPYALSLTSSQLVTHPLTLTGVGTINGGWSATVTVSTNMALSGANTGLKFGSMEI